MPKISVLCPSFNHEKYVSYFIKSVLKQTFQDFELIIVDDCSTDNNVNEILKFKDNRIKLVKNEFNKGINETINVAFRNSSASIIVFCASDDMMEDNALETIYQIHSSSDIVALYCDVIFVDENNTIRQDLMDIHNFFNDNKNFSRYDFLHKAFFDENILSSPLMSIKRNYFKKIYPLPPSSCIYQDYKMHVELLALGDIKLIKDRLVKYRRTYDKKSISAESEITNSRHKAEIFNLLDSFLKINDVELLKKVFEKEIQQIGIEPHIKDTHFFLGIMALLSPHAMRKYWGFNTIMKSYNKSMLNDNYLYEIYNFSYKNYLALAKYCDDDEFKKCVTKYKKYRKLFKITLSISIVLLILLIICILLLSK